MGFYAHWVTGKATIFKAFEEGRYKGGLPQADFLTERMLS